VTVADLPAINAGLNSLATVFLTVGFVAICRQRKVLHGSCMASAFLVSVIFLITYVAHKILVGGVHTPFGGEGPIRWFYYGMLISHIILAIIIVPLILITLFHISKRHYDRHRWWGKITFPIWYYVSVTGVLVYFFLYHWFPSAV